LIVRIWVLKTLLALMVVHAAQGDLESSKSREFGKIAIIKKFYGLRLVHLNPTRYRTPTSEPQALQQANLSVCSP
jgi:hypothetical protein